MTRFEKRLLGDTSLLGIALTILTILLDRVGVLRSFELFLDDQRAAHFQYYRKPPTDQLVHLDIDDATLEFVGNWPWPREILAQIMDELDIAGAKVVDMDVMFPQAQKPTIEEEGQPPVDHDQLFADAIRRFGAKKGRGVLIPVSINLNDLPNNDPVYRALYNELDHNLELSDDELATGLIAHGVEVGLADKDVKAWAPEALDKAMFTHIKHLLDSGHPPDVEALRAILLPIGNETGKRTDALRALESMLPNVQSYESLLRFMRPCPAGLPPLLTEDNEQSPIPALARAASYTGFVDLWKVDDATVRCLPLWIIDRGQLVPQMGLALACAQLGVNTNDLILKPDSVTIPLPGGDKIVIPVSVRKTPDRGQVGMLMDVPWFGGDRWEDMYDWPAQEQPKQHMAMTKIWDICKIAGDISQNNREAMEDVVRAVTSVTLAAEQAAAAQAARAQAPPLDDTAAWNKLMSDTLDNLPPGTLDDYKDYLQGSAKLELLSTQKDRDLVPALRNLTRRQQVNKDLESQRAELRSQIRERLNGKAVLIGWIATGGVDFRPTPLHKECPGVVVHGAIFNAIITRDLLRRAPEWMAPLATLIVGLLVSFASAAFPPWRALGSALLVAGVFFFFNFSIAYDRNRLEMDAAGPPMAAVMIWSGCTLTRFIREQTEKKRITDRFRSYVDPSLVNYVLEHPEQATLKGEERELSVVFTDLQGFTSVSETLKTETVSLLNEYLGLMEPVIRQNHGLVNKFLGDGIMFFFGAPEPYPGDASLHAWAAVQTVVEMQRVMVPFNAQLVKRNLPTLKMRAGVSTGDMVVGDAGTPSRSDYTVLGDRVNFAARLESANKYTGTLILVSDRTVELLRGRYLVRPIGRLQVVGKTEPVMTYEPMAPVEQATEEMRKLVKMTEAVTSSFISAQFADCIAATHELLTTFGEPSQGKLCALYRRLSMEYLRIPPQEFHGQIKLESK